MPILEMGIVWFGLKTRLLLSAIPDIRAQLTTYAGLDLVEDIAGFLSMIDVRFDSL